MKSEIQNTNIIQNIFVARYATKRTSSLDWFVHTISEARAQPYHRGERINEFDGRQLQQLQGNPSLPDQSAHA